MTWGMFGYVSVSAVKWAVIIILRFSEVAGYIHRRQCHLSFLAGFGRRCYEDWKAGFCPRDAMRLLWCPRWMDKKLVKATPNFILFCNNFPTGSIFPTQPRCSLWPKSACVSGCVQRINGKQRGDKRTAALHTGWQAGRQRWKCEVTSEGEGLLS